MPELPEVETVRKGLQKRLLDFQIEKIKIYRERVIASEGGSTVFIKGMKGVKIERWERRGKYLLANLHKDLIDPKTSNPELVEAGWWVIHLRMTGQFQCFPKKTKPCPHTRISFWNAQGFELRFVDTRSFGQMWWIPCPNKPEETISGLARLGPEPFSKEFNPAYLSNSLRKRTRPIKSSLLDQSIIAGIGNIYADESLFEAGIIPSRKSGSLTDNEISRLCSKIIQVLKRSIKEGGTTFKDFRDLEGLNGNYGEQASVYRRTNQPCRKCEEIIQKCIISGRSTHWCPNCQS